MIFVAVDKAQAGATSLELSVISKGLKEEIVINIQLAPNA